MSVMSAEEFLRNHGPKQPRRRNKYNVSAPKDRTWQGRCYDSKAEMLYAQEQWAMVGSVLSDIVEQPRVPLGADTIYRPDFLILGYINYYVDVKGVETAAFRKIKKLWSKYGRLSLHVVVRKGKRFATKEVIPPHA